MNARIVEFPSREIETQEDYPFTDACRSILEERLEEGETLPPEIEEGLLDLRDLEENSPEASLGFAFTLLLDAGVDDPERMLIEKEILEETKD